MTARETLGAALFFAALGLLLGTLVFRLVCMPLRRRRLYPTWAGARCVPVRGFTRWQLAALSTDLRLGLAAAVALSALLLFGGMAAYGGMTPSAAAGAGATFVVLMLLYGWAPLRNGIVPLLPLLRAKDFGRRNFRYVDGAWQYVDEEWFIRVGGNASCALRAPSLDFSRPVRPTTIAGFDTRGRAVNPQFLPALRVPLRDGGETPASIGLSPALERWIASHGGRVRP